MILAIDIGNTNTSFGLFRGRRLARRFDLPTALGERRAELRRRLRVRLAGRRVEQTLICSVVPRMTVVLVRALRGLGAGRIRVVGRELKVPLWNRYRHPKQVGQDRLVGAYAAWRTYKQDCIVCDFGTAITIDVVKAGSHRGARGGRAGQYLGGVIAPGLDISLDALASRTALLPKVELREPPELLGRDTANSIRSGVLHGCVALCDGLVSQLKRRYAPTATVVATGGASALIAKHARTIDHLKPHLVLEGLFLLK